MKKIWLFCLCLASLNLVGCFHIPDKDWLPSKNNVETWSIQKDEETEQVINEFMDWINMISSDWNEFRNEESDEITAEEVENIEVEDEEINDEEIIDNKVESEKIENEVAEDVTVSE